jgi:rhodanese-related sulfurtransferase
MTTKTEQRVVACHELGPQPGDDWLVVDVRTPGEFGGAHIEGSVNAPLGGLAGHAPDLRARAEGKRVALVCRTGRRAEEARGLLERELFADHGEVCVLDGGVEAWERAGFHVVRGEAGMSLERQVRIVAGLLVVLGSVLGLTVHIGFVGLAAFVGAGLVFAGVNDTCGMAMMLAKMPWNRGPVGACAR